MTRTAMPRSVQRPTPVELVRDPYIRAGELSAERHADHFIHDTPDEIWLAEDAVGLRSPMDRRILYKPNERDAVVRHRVALLVVIGTAPFAEFANAFVDTLPRIEHFFRRHRPPLIAKIYRPCR